MALLGSVLAAALVVFAYVVSTSPTVNFSLTAFEVVSDTSVRVTWQVSREPDTVSYCVLRAQNDQRQDVGYATVTVAAGPGQAQVTYHLTTESRAILAEVLACSNRPTMRVAAPNFPPGVNPPEQVPPGVAPTN